MVRFNSIESNQGHSISIPILKYCNSMHSDLSVYGAACPYNKMNKIHVCLNQRTGPPGFFGIWGEWLFLFKELGSTGNYFRGSGEKAYSFVDLGSPAKKFFLNLTLMEKPPFLFDF